MHSRDFFQLVNGYLWPDMRQVIRNDREKEILEKKQIVEETPGKELIVDVAYDEPCTALDAA